MIIDSGYCAAEPTSIVDPTSNSPVVLREGKAMFKHLFDFVYKSEVGSEFKSFDKL